MTTNHKLQVYYKMEKVKAIFNLIDPKKVDINHGNKHLKNVNKSDLMISLVDYETMQKTLEDKIDKIKEILE